MIRKPAVPAPAAPRQTFGERMAARMAAQTPPPMAQAAAQQAQRNMAPGTGGRGTQQYEARRQQQAMPSGQGLGRGMAPPSQMLQASGPTGYVGPQSGGFGPMSTATTNPSQMGVLPNAKPGGMAPMGPGTQTGGSAPMGMAPPNAAKVGMFKKGGRVCYADGGKAEEKKDPPIPAETLASMKRQAAQEKADRQQAKEQKAGEKEVRDNMGRIGFKKGGSIKASKMGAVKVSKPTMRSASSRADGIAIRGKTRA